MIAPVVFYLFLNSIGNVALNDNNLTTIVFNEKIESPHSGASRNELFLKVSPNKKMIFLKSKGVDVDTNLSVPTESGKLYMFHLRKEKESHSLIQVEDGQLDTVFKLILSKDSIKIYEGDHTVKVVNHAKNSRKINYRIIKPQESIYLPKGPSVYVDGERFYK